VDGATLGSWPLKFRSQHYHPRLIEAAMALNENRLDVAERI
jgi:hypothetical protein